MTFTAKQIEQRRHFLGGSEAAGAIGISPWTSRFALWAEKTGRLPPEDLSHNEAVKWGTWLEPLVLRSLAEDTGREIAPWDQDMPLRSTEYPWMSATPDATEQPLPADEEQGFEGIGIVEAKTANFFATKDWDEVPPLHYQVQLAHNTILADSRWGTLCCLIGGQNFVRHDMRIAPSVIDYLLEEEAKFWAFVTTDTPPPLDASESVRKAIARLHPKDTGEVAELCSEAGEWDDRLVRLKEELKHMNTEKKELENKLRFAIGDNTIGILPSGDEYSLRHQDRKAHVVAASSFRVLRRSKK